MMLRQARKPVNGQPTENCFEAIDEYSGSTLGSCVIYVQENENLFPLRPLRIYMEIEGETVPDSLLGASVARAKEIAMKYQCPARIFTQVSPENKALLHLLSAIGFRDNDGLVDMQRALPDARDVLLPTTCVTVIDDLDDPIEQKYFLERYNQLYGESFDFEWLQELKSHAEFKRILIISPTGMVGETITWHEGKKGVIFWLHTAKKWRQKGIAHALLDLACKEFTRSGLSYASAEVQARIPNLLRTMESGGFSQAQLIMRYPGIDWH